jgi:hypothetical protein
LELGLDPREQGGEVAGVKKRTEIIIRVGAKQRLQATVYESKPVAGLPVSKSMPNHGVAVWRIKKSIE